MAITSNSDKPARRFFWAAILSAAAAFAAYAALDRLANRPQPLPPPVVVQKAPRPFVPPPAPPPAPRRAVALPDPPAAIPAE